MHSAVPELYLTIACKPVRDYSKTLIALNIARTLEKFVQDRLHFIL